MILDLAELDLIEAGKQLLAFLSCYSVHVQEKLKVIYRIILLLSPMILPLMEHALKFDTYSGE
jgi:hypothetical protein